MLRPGFIHKKYATVIFSIICFAFNFFLTTNSNAADSLSYSGRLVQANGAPVAGPVNLLVELAYSGTPTNILCSQSFTGVALTNGVFHLKLDLACGANGTIANVLSNVPAAESAAIRVTDTSHSKTYTFQAIHSMPFANIATTAKQLSQMGATTGQVLLWNGSAWAPGNPGGSGTVTSVTGTLPISVATGTSTPAISISQANSTTNGYLSSADWNTFNSKQGTIAAGTALQYYRGDKTWATLDTSAVPENVANLYFTNARVLGVPLTGFVVGAASTIAATDTTLQAFGKAQGQIDTINTARANYLIKNATDSITGVVNVGTIGALNLTYTPTNLTDAVNKAYVDADDALRVAKAGDTMSGALALDGTLKIKGGTNYVTINGNAASTAYNLILPITAGSAGNVLQTDGAGNLSWMAPSTTATPTGAAGGDLAGTYPNPTVPGLATKISTTLTNGNILVGNASNVATAVAVSGDATLANTGALTLKNTGTAGTYSSVTTDAQGRVISGSNPTVVTAVSVTAPISNTGTASNPSLAIPAATTAVNGYLTATDWNTFNNKQAAITAASTINTGSVTTNLQGGIIVNPYGAAAGNTGEIRLQELVANGTNYVALKSPDALAANVTYTLPIADGSNGQVLTTNSTGGLSWTTVATSGTTLAGDVGGTISANTIGAGKVTLTHLSATGTKNNTTYLRGDNTWATFGNDVLSTLLTGLSLTTSGVIATTDSVVAAFGKLQKQISDLTVSAVGGDLTGNLPNPTVAKLQGGTLTITTPAAKNVLKYNGTAWVNSQLAASDLSATGTTDATTYLAGDNTWKNFNTNVIAAPLTGLAATATKATSTLAATDSITVAFNKLLFTQGDYVSKTADQTINGTLAINSATGFITVPTPINPNDAANKGYVDGFGQWTKGTGVNAADIYRASGNVGIGTSTPARNLSVQSTALVVADFTTSSTAGIVDVVSTNATGSAMFRLGAANSTKGWQVGAEGSSGNLNIQAGMGATFPNPAVSILTGGNVGIGTTTPQSKLDVNGAIRVGADATACSATIAGAMRFNTPNVEYCNGSAWTAIAAANTSGVTSVNTLTGAVSLTTTNIAEGTNLYYTNARGIASTITAPTLTNAAIATGDSLQVVAGKLQAQFNNVLSLALTGLSTATSAVITSADTIIGAFGKLQAQISAHSTTIASKADQTNISQTITAATVTGLTAPVAGADAVNKTYVDSFGQWTKGASSSINYIAGNVGVGTTTPSSALHVVGQVTTNSISVPWALANSYPAGAIVENGGSFYKSNSAIPANTAFATGSSGATWTSVSVAGSQNQVWFNVTDGTYAAPAASTAISIGKAYTSGSATFNPVVTQGGNSAGTNGFNTTTGQFKPPLPGRYYLQAQASASVSNGFVAILVNGTIVAQSMMYVPSPTWYSGNVSAIRDLATTDVVTFQYYPVNGTSIGSTYNYQITGFLLPTQNVVDAKYVAGTASDANKFLKLASDGQTINSSIGLYESATGNVGIGTSNPTSKLSISAASNFGFDMFSTTATTKARMLSVVDDWIGLSQNTSFVGTNTFNLDDTTKPGWLLKLDGRTGSDAFEVWRFAPAANPVAYTTANTLFRISNNGNVGIGTTTPTEKLSIQGDGRAIFGPNTTWGANLVIGGNGHTGTDASVVTTNGNLHLDAKSGTTGTFLNWYAGTGGVLVGNATAGGYGPIFAASFNVSSDRRLKKNIENIQDALEIIDQLNGVRFDWINPKESKARQVGVIAQDVQKVLPELVSVNKQTQRLTVNYSGLTAPLIEAVKELYHRWIDDSSAVHREIASVKAENAKLKQENAAIKAYICSKDPKAAICL